MATLITGTTVAQVIPIALSPILTRIYSPDDFGILTLYVSICAIFSVISTLRYELAIVQPRSNKDAKSIVIISLVIVSVLSAILLVSATLINILELDIFKDKSIYIWLYFVPFSVFFMGLYNISNYWLLREGQYREMSKSKMVQGTSLSISKVLIGLIKNNGLIIGHIIGQFFSTMYVFKRSNKYWSNIEKPSKIRIKRNLTEYKAMPLYSSPGAFADTLSSQLPVFTITYFFGSFITGFFGLTFRILNMPAALVSSAISQVILKEIMDREHNKSQKNLISFVLKIFFSLLALITPFGIFIWFFGESVFSIVFGENWSQAGSMSSILIIAVVIRFSVSPLSSILSVKENIKLGVLWQFCYLVTLSSTLMFFSKSKLDIFLWAFVIHEVAIYSLYLLMILIGAKRLQGVK